MQSSKDVCVLTGFSLSLFLSLSLRAPLLLRFVTTRTMRSRQCVYLLCVCVLIGGSQPLWDTVCIFRHTCTHTHTHTQTGLSTPPLVSHWAEQMNNMPVTELIQPPTPELHKDKIYLSVCVRVCVCVCVRVCVSVCVRERPWNVMQWDLNRTEVAAQ